MSEVPLHDAHPGLSVDLDDGEHVTGVVAFLLIEDASDHRTQQVQVTATDGLSAVTVRGLVELGRESLIADQSS